MESQNHIHNLEQFFCEALKVTFKLVTPQNLLTTDYLKI